MKTLPRLSTRPAIGFLACLVAVGAALTLNARPEVEETAESVFEAPLAGVKVRLGNKRGELVRVGSDIHIERGETVSQLVVVFGDVKMEGKVEGDMVVVFGSVEVDGRVEGDFVNVMGTVKLGPNAELDHDCIVVGGGIDRHPSAILSGDPVEVNLGGLLSVFEPVTRWLRSGLLLGRPLPPGLGWAWSIAIIHFVIYFIIALLLPKPVGACVKTLDVQPVQAFVAGILGLIICGGPVLFILVASGVGLLLIPFLWLAFMAATLLGKTATFQYLGTLLYTRLSPTSSPSPLAAFLVGIALVTLLYIIPIFGLIAWAALLTLGFGASIVAGFNALRPDGGNGRKKLEFSPVKPTPSTTPPVTEQATPIMKASTTSTSVALATSAKPAKASKTSVAEHPKAAPKATKGKKSKKGVKVEDSKPLGDTDELGQVRQGDEPPAIASSDLQPGAGEAPTPDGSFTLTEGELASMPRVGFFHRLAASSLDFILLFWIIPATTFGWFVLAWLGYHVAMWLWKGTTVGGIICGIKIVRLDGRQLDASIVVVRALAAVLSFVALGLGFFWAGWVPEKQSWHDKVAGTTIVKLPKGTSLV